MMSKVLLALCLTVAIAVAVPAQAAPGFGPPAWLGGGGAAAGGANPWLPPWVASAPWFPQWTPCTTVGPSCLDCNTKMVCTKVGGIQKACSDPTMPYCNLGECSATPTPNCAPAAVPATTA